MNDGQDNLATRITLLQQAQSGMEHPAWEEIVGYYHPFVTRILRAMGFRDADLEDVRQVVFLKLWKGLTSYQHQPERARFRTWLSRLVRNAATDWTRENSRFLDKVIVLHIEDTNQCLSTPSQVEQYIESEWQKHIVDLAVNRLRKIFSVNAFEIFIRSLRGESTIEIAKQLGLRKESVYVLRTRVKLRLSQELIQIRRELEFPED